MYCLIFLLLFCQLSAMQPKLKATEIVLSKKYPENKVNSAVFIDEENVAVSGTEACFIFNLVTQAHTNIGFNEPNREFFNLCINQDKTLLGYNTTLTPYIYNIKTREIISPCTYISWSSKATLGFTNRNYLIAYENNTCVRFNERLFAEKIPINPPCSIINHSKDNTFLLCNKQKFFYVMNMATGDCTIIKTCCSCKQVAYSPCSNFVFIKNKKNSIFIANKNDMRKNTLQTKKIGSKKTRYYCLSFYPKNTLLALLNKKGFIEYRNCTNPTRLIATQDVISQESDSFNAALPSSLRFSPEGNKVAVIINGKCLLLNAPLNIRCFNGWLIWHCIKNYFPKEISLMIMDYMQA